MQEVERMIPSEVALLKVSKEGFSPDNLVDAIVSRLKNRTAPYSNSVGLMPPPQDRVYVGDKPAGAPGNQMPADIVREGLAFNGIYFGGSVQVAWDGDPQNTFENAQDSVAALGNRISGTEGFIDTSGMFVTLGDGAKSGFGLVRQNNGAEVVLVAGQKFQATPRSSSYLDSYLNLVPGANQFADMMDGKVLDSQEFTITGIYEQDNINVRKHFGEEFQIVPIGNGSHYLTVLPHAVGVPDIGNRVFRGIGSKQERIDAAKQKQQRRDQENRDIAFEERIYEGTR
jgi:hypothetical protein